MNSPNGTDCTCSHIVQLLGAIFQIFEFQSEVFGFFRVAFSLGHFLSITADFTQLSNWASTVQHIKQTNVTDQQLITTVSGMTSNLLPPCLEWPATYYHGVWNDQQLITTVSGMTCNLLPQCLEWPVTGERNNNTIRTCQETMQDKNRN